MGEIEWDNLFLQPCADPALHHPGAASCRQNWQHRHKPPVPAGQCGGGGRGWRLSMALRIPSNITVHSITHWHFSSIVKVVWCPLKYSSFSCLGDSSNQRNHNCVVPCYQDSVWWWWWQRVVNLQCLLPPDTKSSRPQCQSLITDDDDTLTLSSNYQHIIIVPALTPGNGKCKSINIIPLK